MAIQNSQFSFQFNQVHILVFAVWDTTREELGRINLELGCKQCNFFPGCLDAAPKDVFSRSSAMTTNGERLTSRGDFRAITVMGIYPIVR